MPANPKILLIVIAVLETIVGLAAVLSPATALAQTFPGIEGGAAGEMAMRMAGTALIALGALAWLARDATEAAVLRPVLGGLLVYNVLAVLNLGWLGLTTVPNLLPFAILHVILSGALLFYMRKAR
jgi:hypothetical protein